MPPTPAPEHLNALRAFEASARHESFSGAAAELHVTPAAVGQLVRTLEDALGAPLFQRLPAHRAGLLQALAALEFELRELGLRLRPREIGARALDLGGEGPDR